ncbi:MAG: hypothetical protein KUG77_22080 [Nannocystaceae bacterium]|nr:hypothetical protein [Nannocystaceae bacterium]
MMGRYAFVGWVVLGSAALGCEAGPGARGSFASGGSGVGIGDTEAETEAADTDAPSDTESGGSGGADTEEGTSGTPNNDEGEAYIEEAKLEFPCLLYTSDAADD